MGARVGPHVCANQTSDDDSWGPTLAVISALSSPKGSSTVPHCWAGRPPHLLLCHVPPTGWGLPCSSHCMLELTCPISTAPLAPNYRYQRCITHRSLFLHCLAPAGTIMAPLCGSWVTSTSKPLPKDVAGNRGSSRARHDARPALALHCPSQFLCPMPKSFFKTLHAELMEKGAAPPPQRTTCASSTLCCYNRQDFIHFPALSPFSISHWALNHGRLWEVLRPWQEAAAAAGVITALQKAPACHCRFHGNKYRITENRPWCFMGFEAFYHLQNTLTHFY